jgi:hypothetical protein
MKKSRSQLKTENDRLKTELRMIRQSDIYVRTQGMTIECPQCKLKTKSGGHDVCLWCEIEKLRGN